MKTAIFLDDSELIYIENLLKKHEKDNFSSFNGLQQKVINSLIETFEKRGVEQK
jgi:hypothetical protein